MNTWKVALLILAVLGGTSSLRASQSGMPGPMSMQDCPMKIQDFELAASNTTTGVAITFTTKPDQVDTLRLRVQHWAAMHTAGPEQQHGMRHGTLPGTAEYEAIPNGIRLTLTATDPAKLEEFRAAARTRVEAMKKGDCSLMQEMMQGMRMSGKAGAPKSEKPTNPAETEANHSQHHPETR